MKLTMQQFQALTTWFVTYINANREDRITSAEGLIEFNELMKSSHDSTIRQQVSAFHDAMEQPILEVPSIPADERVRLRLRLVTEECFELVDACVDAGPWAAKLFEKLLEIIDTVPVKVDLPNVADALGDIDYVVEGTRLEFGINGAPIAAEIHRSNMAKVGGPTSPEGKKLKPPGWTPPDFIGELVKQGWVPKA